MKKIVIFTVTTVFIAFSINSTLAWNKSFYNNPFTAVFGDIVINNGRGMVYTFGYLSDRIAGRQNNGIIYFLNSHNYFD